MERRSFVKSLLASSVVAGFPLKSISNNAKKLDVLVLGGRDFLGPAIVEAAISNDHKVTLFNRNITNNDLFTELPLIIGDRTEGSNCYDTLLRKEWDVVIDVWPQQSKLVDEATLALQDKAGHYMFISSIAVYADYHEIGLNEQSDLITLPKDQHDWGYSEEKMKSEQLVAQRFPTNHTILRPGAIKGWRDPAIDLTYWLLRFKKNKEVLAPGTGVDPIQFVDVKDVGSFVIHCLENGHVGIFNTIGPKKEPLQFEAFLEACKKHTRSQAEIVWVDQAFLRENKIRSFDDIPLWAPLDEDPGFMQISNQKAEDHGFKHSELSTTFKDVLDWFDQGIGGAYNFGKEHNSIGLSFEKEQELLRKWQG